LRLLSVFILLLVLLFSFYLEQPRAELLRRNARRDTSLPNKTLLGMLHRWDLPLPTEAHRVVYSV